MTEKPPPISLFYSYSHRDEELRDELETHLSPLWRQGIISQWHDRKIEPGDKWDRRIEDQVNTAQIILLLVSPYFIASDYCYENEMQRAIERDANGEAVVIPIILKPCDWQKLSFGQMQALPRDGKAVTTWENRDEAFVDIARGIRKRVERLQAEKQLVEPPLESRRLDAGQYGEDLKRRNVAELRIITPYLLLGKEDFVGREQDLAALSDWLASEQNRMFCICDLGGTGKSALVWHWLHQPETGAALDDRRINLCWSTFYAKNFNSVEFLKRMASQLGGVPLLDREPFWAQKQLQQFVLDRLQNGKWLLVLDGLEREMGAFTNPEHRQVDSEEQDQRNEDKQVMPEERYIRNTAFAEFIRGLLKTQAKVLITSRLFPENLIGSDGKSLPGVIRHPFVPMSPEDAVKVWNRFGEPDGSSFQREFFERVGYHPQVISVVAAAAKAPSLRLADWFGGIPEVEGQACLNAASITSRRHRWLELATRDVIVNHRDAWMLLCYIVRSSDASRVDDLMNDLVDCSPADQARPGAIRSVQKVREYLDYLAGRRLIGIGDDEGHETADVHPVIRGHVMQYVLRAYRQGGKESEDLVRMLESGGSADWMLRYLNQPDPEEQIRLLSSRSGVFLDAASEQNPMLGFLGRFFTDAAPGGSPWLDALPALPLRKDQAWVMLRTANELMSRGRWEDSEKVFRRASLAYQLCGDLESVEDCRHSHSWQSLYGGRIWEAEQQQMNRLKPGVLRRADYTEYWLALLLSIRQSEHAAALLRSLPVKDSRWTLQTAAEAWFYLEDYEEATALAQEAYGRRGKEDKESVGQLLWERVTLGLALVRLRKYDDAEAHLQFANERGTGWAYNLVPKFALAGLIELYYERAGQNDPSRSRLYCLNEAGVIYKQYCSCDPEDRFQIPAAEAHLAMARVLREEGKGEEAIKLANRALRVARGQTPPFQYASLVRRATEFLIEELKQPPPPIDELGHKARQHEARLRKWMYKRNR